MNKKGIIGITVLLVVVFAVSFVISSSYLKNNNTSILTTSAGGSYSLGSNERGYVVKEGPYGNVSSPVKIAYITGVHPLESKSHKAAIDAIKTQNKSLHYCYYIYKINVTKDAADYDKGRMNGQLLANQYVVPDIKSQNFQLAIDIHSNEGHYLEKRFIFAPQEEKRSKSIALMIKNKIPWMVYYNPSPQTSPQYVTIPLINAGIPAVLYETYVNDSYAFTKEHADEFVSAVDNLKL
ncbi:M14 family metallopeptidase [Methanobacterium bryantii]|uniref:Adhesin n=1 Tax=Methanobacterium bryantii TaxID=2161 RepID=A0A2A2H7R3_METBR|nr:hypothetical protein [Methanobacterium bryantii]PAV05442.1 hypothetical protein ASJ80_09325 [Methanobacterium bryantii]